MSITEGNVSKGGQNPPNTSTDRPAPPQGSAGMAALAAIGYQDRVREEKRELDAKIVKLQDFIERGPGSVPVHEWFRLRIQLQAMETYSTILGERIADFEEKP